jgi:DNA-binding NarL/FixJ family response regulator
MPRCLFLSESGDMLPRWLEAFPKASSAGLEETATHGKPPELIWLRKREGSSVTVQLGALRERFGLEVPCIVLSDIPHDAEALEAFSASARGYCNAHATPEVLRQAATVVSQGGLWIGEALMQRLIAVVDKITPAAKEKSDEWAAPLTERERQVANTIAAGASNKEIARQLGITERTVKAHVGSILEKLQVRDRLQLALVIGGRQKPE